MIQRSGYMDKAVPARPSFWSCTYLEGMGQELWLHERCGVEVSAQDEVWGVMIASRLSIGMKAVTGCQGTAGQATLLLVKAIDGAEQNPALCRFDVWSDGVEPQMAAHQREGRALLLRLSRIPSCRWHASTCSFLGELEPQHHCPVRQPCEIILQARRMTRFAAVAVRTGVFRFHPFAAIMPVSASSPLIAAMSHVEMMHLLGENDICLSCHLELPAIVEDHHAELFPVSSPGRGIDVHRRHRHHHFVTSTIIVTIIQLWWPTWLRVEVAAMFWGYRCKV